MNDHTRFRHSMNKNKKYQTQYQELLDLLNPQTDPTHVPPGSNSSSIPNQMEQPKSNPSTFPKTAKHHSKDSQSASNPPPSTSQLKATPLPPIAPKVTPKSTTKAKVQAVPSKTIPQTPQTHSAPISRSSSPNPTQSLISSTSPTFSIHNNIISDFRVSSSLLQKSHRFVITLDKIGTYQFYGPDTSDFTQGGLFIPTGLLTRIGDPVFVQVKSDKVPPFVLKGSVQWIREPVRSPKTMESGIGVCFEGVSQGAKKVLEFYMQKQEILFYLD